MWSILKRLRRHRPLTGRDLLRRFPGPPREKIPASIRLEGNADDFDLWTRRQSLKDIRRAGEAPFFFAPGSDVPDVETIWLESAMLIAAAENLDAVFFADDSREDTPEAPENFEQLVELPWRRWTLFSSRTFSFDGTRICRTEDKQKGVAKIIPAGGLDGRHDAAPDDAPLRRGPYLFETTPPNPAVIHLADPLGLDRTGESQDKKSILITAPFLARGGAEQTLYSTMDILKEHYNLVFLTLAGHRAELEDRRPDFRRLSPLVYSIGDWMHPDAMPAVLESLILKYQIGIWYNANGSTLFYEFLPRIRKKFPAMRIVDHLYDHRVGYISAYGDGVVRRAVDTVIAENYPIAATLRQEYGESNPPAPVIWPCGRPPEELPPVDQHGEIRQRIRKELGVSEETVVFLTAARIHQQKRPLDLVEIAARAPENTLFLLVGGGPMEEEIDRKIAESNLENIRRLGFRADIPELILAADAGLLVSEFEGLPVFALECLQLGRPFIGTDAGDLGKLIGESGAGIISGSPGDINAISEAIRRMMRGDLRKAFAAKAREASGQFSPDSCAQKMARVFEGQWE